MEEFIYVIYREDTGWYKIGRSRAPFTRLEAIKNELKPAKVSLVICMAVEQAPKTEFFLHTEFKEFCKDGEWFCFDGHDFMPSLVKVCLENKGIRGVHISPTHTATLPDEELSELIRTHYVLSYSKVNGVVGHKYKGTATLPMKMRVLGCYPVVVSGVKYYVTPAGKSMGLCKKENRGTMRKLLDSVVDAPDSFRG